VITNTTGGPLDRTSDREDWHVLLASAGLRRLRIHDLRHSAATALLPDLRRTVAQRQTTLWQHPGDHA
jgi:integrase